MFTVLLALVVVMVLKRSNRLTAAMPARVFWPLVVRHIGRTLFWQVFAALLVFDIAVCVRTLTHASP